MIQAVFSSFGFNKRRKPTRGFGLLEGFLANQRSQVANSLIDPNSSDGLIVDFGCGLEPFFLEQSTFVKKIGLDKAVRRSNYNFSEQLLLICWDLACSQYVPIKTNSANIVTMLAVFEHIEPLMLSHMLREINRILVPGGHFIITTPAWWTDKILKLMAATRLVSRAEIEEHKDAYSMDRLTKIVAQVFDPETIEVGYFELYMNMWLKCKKQLHYQE